MIFNFFISLIFLFQTGANKTSEIEEYLKSKLIEFKRFEFQLKQGINKSDFEIDYSSDFRRRGEYGYIPILLKKGNKQLKTIATVKLKLFKDVYISKIDIKKGEELSPLNFIRIEKNVAKLRRKPIQFNAYKMVAKKKIKSGIILTEDLVKAKPVIRQGDKVTAFVKHGNVEIRVEAIAKGDAGIGDELRIKALRKFFRARAVSKNEVLIIE